MAGQAQPGADPLATEVSPAQFTAAMAPLTELNFPTANWTPDTIRGLNMRAKTFLDSIKILTSQTDAAQRRVLVNCMTSKDFFLDAQSATPMSLVAGCNFLRSPAGSKLLAEKQFSFRAKIQKKVTASRDIHDVSMLAIFNRQYGDMQQEIKQTREEAQTQIAEWTRLINKKRTECIEAIRAIRMRFQPAGGLPEISKHELESKAVELYNAEPERTASGLGPAALTDSVIEAAVAKYGAEIRDKHSAQFLRDEQKREQLKVYLREKVHYYEEVGDLKDSDD